MLSPEDIARLVPAETARFRCPIPTQSVARAEYDLHGEGRTNLRYGDLDPQRT